VRRERSAAPRVRSRRTRTHQIEDDAMTESPRARKIADLIKTIVAETLERRIKDPRLGFVTVTDVRVTGDLQHATIFYTVFGDDEERVGTAAALESAKGVLRREVGKGVGLRLTPSLELIPDAMPENASHIDDLLRQAAERDAEVSARASASRFAGDPDPYRRREDELAEVGEADAVSPAEAPAAGSEVSDTPSGRSR
jgi:ribosome-binding factor A